MANIARKTINNLIEAGVISDDNMLVIHGDGYDGYKKLEGYDKIIVTAAPDDKVAKRLEQLKISGILISPLHDTKTGEEHILRIDRLSEDEFKTTDLIGVRFVDFVEKEGIQEGVVVE